MAEASSLLLEVQRSQKRSTDVLDGHQGRWDQFAAAMSSQAECLALPRRRIAASSSLPEKKVFNNTPIFAQDNAPCHVARSTLEWFRKHHVQLLQGFPPYSPDINIMENCWAVMAKEMEGCYAPNKHVLWDHIQKAHKKITVTYIEKLYASLKPRLEAIITAKGGHTKY